jgi:hypothetical protein
MKKTALFASLLCLAQSTLHADVPLFINYQGKVADSTGLPIGASGTAAAPVAAPTNRKVIFRIYDASTGGTRLWTEEQTATISLGVFSVLLGNGIDPTGTAISELRPALDTIFTPSAASSRFLEITVDNGDNAITGSDVPISPRQQITSTAFALHARVADGIASSSDLTINPPTGTGTASNYGLGWYGTGRLFNSVAVDGPVLYGNAGGALGSNVGGTQKLALSWDAAGQVGIGATSSYDTNNKLTLQGDDSATPARQLVIRGNTDTTKRLNIGFDTTANKASLQSYGGVASSTGLLLLNPNGGNVGINNTSPLGRFTVNSGNSAFTINHTDVTTGAWIRNDGNTVFSTNYGDMYFGLYGNSKNLHFMGGGSTDAMTVTSSGNVGVKNMAPSVALDVTGAIKASTNIQALGNVYGSVFQASNYIEAFGRISANGSSGFNFFNGGDADGGLYSPADGTVTIKTNATERMRVDPNGNVGIGTTAPDFKLTIIGGSIAAYGTNAQLVVGNASKTKVVELAIADTSAAWSSSAAVGDAVFRSASSKLLLQSGFGAAAITIDTSNNVGIGTNSPTQAKLVVSGGLSSYSIWATAYIGSLGHIAFSDERIKNIQGRSDRAKDLETLLGIEVTDYRYKDVSGNGNTPQKKVIAQQVEKVFPQAVSRTTYVVPDIYQKAALNDGWIKLATDLKKGERVKLISKNEEGVHEVLEVAAGKFRTDFKSADAGVFVYGREVNDFRTVDYDAISMLNVSATQELKREKDAELQTLRDENAALRRELAAKDASLETRLMALERRMSGEGATETVSLKTAQAVK